MFCFCTIFAVCFIFVSLLISLFLSENQTSLRQWHCQKKGHCASIRTVQMATKTAAAAVTVAVVVVVVVVAIVVAAAAAAVAVT